MIFDFIKNARQLFFDKSKSGMAANNVQDAIDELNSNLGGMSMVPDWKNYIQVTESSAYNVTYTAPSNGYLRIIVSSTNVSGSMLLCSIDGVGCANLRPGSTSGRLTTVLPIAKGSTFIMKPDTGNSNYTNTASITFVPCV